MKMKRFLAVLLALCLLLSYAPTGALAAETVASGTCGDTATWSLENGVLTISGTGMMANYDLEMAAPWFDYAESITSVVVEDGISFVGSYAFAELPNLTEATIADSVTFILEGAFFNCPALETVKLSAELDFIGDAAFRYCKSLKDLEIPDSANSIGKYAFHGCHAFTYLKLPEGMPEIPEGMAESCSNLTGVFIPDSVDKIGDNAFMDCASLEAVEIPAGVTSMGSMAFANCGGLTEITFWGDAPAMDDTESLFAGATATVYYPAGNETWTEDVKLNYGGNLTWVPNTLVAAGTCGDNLTWTLDTDGLLTVSGEGAMTEHPWTQQDTATITSVVIEEGVTSICGLSFEGCTNLTSVTVPSTVTDMGGNTFNGCHNLAAVNIPQGVTVLKQGVFMECDSLTAIVIPDSVTEIGEMAFCYSGLETVEIPAGVTSIGEAAFYGCDALDEIVFLGDAPEFGASVFTYVSAMAYYPMGITWTEEVMQDYGGSLTWIAYGGETEELFALSGTSVSLGDNLDLHFIIDPANVMTDYYAVLTRYYADGRDDHVITIPLGDWRVLNDDRFYVTYSGIAAKEMGDYVEITVYNGNGEAVSEVYADSVKSYAMRMLDKEEVIADEELRTLYVDMLNYGAAAQAQFGYNVSMPANDLLTDAQKAYATTDYTMENDLETGPGRAGTTLTLKNRITLDFIFSNSAIGTDHSGLVAVIYYDDHYGLMQHVTVNGSDFRAYDASTSFVSVNLAVADYGQEVTCIIFDANDNIIAKATDSIEGYAYRMQYRLPEIVDAIMKFGVSSYNYFH